MCTQTEPAAPSGTVQALAMVRAGLGYLSACDAVSLGTAVQAEALVGLEQAEAQHTAARAKILAVFSAQQGYQADGQYGPGPWLRAFTRVTGRAAAGAVGWARRLQAHPVIAGALATGQLSASWAKSLCEWTDQLPQDRREDADQILLAAALQGAELADLGALALEMIERSRTGPDRDKDTFNDRAVWLETTLGGAGRLTGDLTGTAAASISAVLEALSAKGGPEDTRTLLQRRHDALQEACQRLIDSGMLPGRDGQPLHLNVHVDLAELNGLPGASELEAGWSTARAAAAGVPGSVYLTGPDAEAAACDAALTPIVSGHTNRTILDQLTVLFLAATGHHSGQNGDPRSGLRQDTDAGQDPDGASGQDPDGASGQDPDGASGQDPDSASDQDSRTCPVRTGCYCSVPHSLDHLRPLLPATRERLQDTLLYRSIDIVSGPTGLASFLRTQLLGIPFSTLSQPLDLGRTNRTVPSHLRKAIIQRDKHCQFPGCTQPPSVCEVHHIIPWSKGGATSLSNCALYCRFHHNIVIHRWGWAVTRNPDGTTTATSPDGRILHSHGPPSAAG